MRKEYTDGEITINADLDQASATVTYIVNWRDAEHWNATPFQTADGGHNATRLLEIVSAWLDSEA